MEPYADTVAWDRPATWLYVAFMTGILIGGLYAVARAWLPSIERALQVRLRRA